MKSVAIRAHPLVFGVVVFLALVFSGTPDQTFYAFDARTGKVLWQHRMTSGVIGQPMSYRVDGTQYIAVQSGWGGVAPFWGENT